ncbi:MAG: SDR family oxidoreductase [Rhodocyclaceae bacterium]|nr:SDR family oxidoreductase [Rhodocyclaceae bacterium]
MKGKTLLVTGAAGGIGSAIVLAFAAEGCRLVLLGRQPAALAALAAAARAAGADARPLVADLLTQDPADIARQAVAAFGCLDGIVNCAGVQHFGLAAEEPATASARTFAVNTVAPIQLTQALLPHLQGRPVAHVVNVGSIFGSIGFPCFATYSASKFALRGYSEALRRELAGGPVRVHYVAPRYTRTGLNRDAVVRMAEALGMNQDSPQTVAERVLASVRRGAADVYLGWPERLCVRINALFPRLVDGALIRQAGRMRPFAQRSDITLKESLT